MTTPIFTPANKKRMKEDRLRVAAFGSFWRWSDDLPLAERFIRAICATADDVPLNRKALANYIRFKHNQQLEKKAIK